MSVEKLIATLRKEAQLADRETIEEAREKAAEARRNAEARMGEIREMIDRARRAEAERRADLDLAREKIRRRRRLLATQEGVRILTGRRFMERFERFAVGDRYAPFIVGRFDAGVAHFDGPPGRVVADRRTADILGAQRGVDVSVDETVGIGFVAENGDGSVRVSFSPNEAFEKNIGDVSEAIARIGEEDGDDGA